MTKKDVKVLIKILKKEFPNYIVRVRFVKLPDELAGDCDLVDKKNNEFKIRINKKLKPEEQCLWVLHEFAHMGAWFSENSDHNAAFGKAYSRIYKIYEAKFCNGEDKNE